MDGSPGDRRTDDGRETLADQGFERIGDRHLADGRVDAEHCWRRGFTFAEVGHGLPVARRDPRTGAFVTDDLLAVLADGESVALLGPPGVGKTTTARMVAARWHCRPDTGTVYYHDGTERIEDPEAASDALAAEADGPVLVVVEDVPRPNARPVLDVVADLDDVRFLVEAREWEWDAVDPRAGRSDAVAVPRRDRREARAAFDRHLTERYHPPLLDEDAVERVRRRFEAATGTRVPAGTDELAAAVQSQHGVSPGLLLSHRLAGGGPGEDHYDALHADVADAFRAVAAAGERSWPHEEAAPWPRTVRESPGTLRDVALLANVLNAAGLAVRREWLHALAAGPDGPSHRRVDGVIDALAGRLFFGEDEGVLGTHHELWSTLYLDRYLADAAARDRVERVVNSLFGLLDAPDRRESVRSWLDDANSAARADGMPETAPTARADEVATAVFELGKRRPGFAPLYGTPGGSTLDLPEACSAETVVDCAFRRGSMHLLAGNHDVAESAFDRARRLGGRLDADPGYVMAGYYTRMAELAFHRGRSAVVEEATRRLHELLEARSDRVGVAESLDALGTAARERGEDERARAYHRRSLGISRDLGDRRGQARSLDHLGIVARRQGDLGTAAEHHRESLRLSRDLGNQRGEAESLDHLGRVAREQGDYGAAVEYHRAGLAVERGSGDRGAEGRRLVRLGRVERLHGDDEAAAEHYRAALRIKRDLGDHAGEVTCLDELGLLARRRSDHEAALEYYRRSRDLERELEDRRGEANSLGNMGIVAGDRGDHEAAAVYFAQAAEIFRGLDATRALLDAYENLALAYENQGKPEDALRTCTKALSVLEEADDPQFADARRSFVELGLRVDDSMEATSTLYEFALQAVMRDEGSEARELLATVWRRREEFESVEETSPVVLGAGVGFTAHTVFYDHEDAAADRRAVLDAVEPHRDQLSDPAAALYDYLVGRDPGVTREDLVDSLAVDSTVDVRDLDLPALEALAYGKVLELLADRGKSA